MEDFRTKQELEAEYSCNRNSGSPAVYVGTYAKYNNGSLYGAWFDLTKFYDYDEFIDACRELHHDEDDPEFMFQDFENFPSVWYNESCMDEDTFDKIREYDDMDGDKKDAFCEFLSEIDEDGSIEDFEERYYGRFYNQHDFAVDYIENEVLPDLSELIPSIILDNIDYDDVFYDLQQECFDFSSNYAFKQI